MRTLSCLLLVLVLVAALPYSVQGQTTDSTLAQPDTSRRAPNPRTALMLGLIPGGGQLYNGKWLKALIVITANWYFFNQFQQARQAYQESQEIEDLEERNKFAWQLMFVYILGLMDAYVDAHLSTFPPDSSYQAQPLPPSNQSVEEGP